MKKKKLKKLLREASLKNVEHLTQFTENDIEIIEKLHDTLLDTHGYQKDFLLLRNARELISKMYSSISQIV